MQEWTQIQTVSLSDLPRERLDLSRILIYGVTGSGKTTLATQLSNKLGLPFHSVDDLAWGPGWEAVSDKAQREIFSTIFAEDRWIVDSAYSRWLDLCEDRATLIIALDYPRWFSLGRLAIRTARRAMDKQTICNGNVEDWRQVFSRKSIIIWHFRSFGRKRQRVRTWVEAGRPVLILPTAKATAAWLRNL